ncbi:MAG: Rpn family recombination-promoting nuclease/putative transposase, partial [Raineya sp.]|nr:Rpn family recombination-promoting nuclease/putative transposase [Raineya sp.]
NFFNDERYRRYFTLKDGDTNETNPDLDYLDLYFVELRKFNGNLTGVRTTLERWITFLNNAYKFQEQQLPQELAEIREIQKANLRLKAMYLDRQERMYYDSQQKFWLDQISYVAETISKAREEGREEGLKEGREEGLKEGIKEGKFLIAKNLIKLGFDDETIMKATGLSNIEIEQIRKNMS